MSRTERSATLRHHMPSTTLVIALLLAIVGSAGGFVYGGVCDIGADAPHWRVMYGMPDEFRGRAIFHHARGLAAPIDL
jgi:hypothetical protein